MRTFLYLLSLKKRLKLCLRYYVLREDMLGYYVNDLVERLNARGEDDGWQVSHGFTS